MFEQSEPGHYDLILMDVQMPVMNGYDATRAIRGCSHPQAETVPIIAMTANTFSEDVKDALDAGMNAHVGKPVDMNLFKSGNQRRDRFRLRRTGPDERTRCAGH